ncbi:MAG: 23S rRNA (pseudouridine(1915)-N(3))-methyltransferase RlmH [Clostridia bacterium]|nr:23S rRNA (pseudouridine(1915)-N(3))-methyltransferase RlmH [Clostridia bacterium]
MKINIVSVGRIKEQYYLSAIEEYIKRLSAYCVVEQTVITEMTCDNNLYKEGQKLLPKLNGYVIVLDRLGTQLDSIELAQRIDKIGLSNSTITVVIGSTDGLDDNVKKRADLLLSFSPMTLPHSLAKVVLAEQLYRAYTIINNGKYHH